MVVNYKTESRTLILQELVSQQFRKVLYECRFVHNLTEHFTWTVEPKYSGLK